MSKVSTALKTRKPKTNNFILILEQFLKKHNLSAVSTLEQLSEHAPELSASLPDWKACKKERVEYCAKGGDAMDIFTHYLELGPKNNDENEIVASSSRQSQFCVKLEEAGVSPEVIHICIKDKELIQKSNKIQREQTKKRMADSNRIPIHFFSAIVTKRLQSINITKKPTMQNLADVIVMLCMRPSEVSSLQINHYEVDPSNVPAWYKEEYSWYYTSYKKLRTKVSRPFLSMEKNPERARELLTWIQEVIKTDKLYDPVYTKSRKRSTKLFREFLKSYRTESKKLRRYRKRHASRTHGGKNPTPEHLKCLSRVTLR
ncbi:hypothetical protein C1646_773465 [Rhizophagus diaphanus]|nr:hypothetical protein C1646_773465 [Rhizophagus diaphanus] [Rhizophagus sp. MUCL 43196]